MRSAEFDRDAVLVQAMETFRAHGYSKTTMQQLVAATGLHPGSIYGAFGNKRGLLLAAVDHYVESKRALRRSLLVLSCAAGVAALARNGRLVTCGATIGSDVKLSINALFPIGVLLAAFILLPAIAGVAVGAMAMAHIPLHMDQIVSWLT